MLRRRRILLATRNGGKVRELKAVLAGLEVDVVGLDELDPRGRIAEPVENGDTFADNARAKAAYYARTAGCWALADDSGLVVDALDGAPGVLSARYAADECPGGAGRGDIDRANNARLLRELSGLPDARRTARFVCHLALSDGRGTLLETTGAVEGRIGYQQRGRNGFGYDPLFVLPDGRTTAELPEEAKNAISHRGQAARKLAAALKEALGGTGV
jgi:XTP/dITP diphosphohydrolase